MTYTAIETADHPSAPAHEPKVEAALGRVRRVAFLLDDAFELPIIKRRIGLDGLVGLIPGVGDGAGWAASAYILIEAARLGVGVPLLVRMGANIAADLVVGAIPLVGDLADVAFKANRRNAALLLEHFGVAEDEPVSQAIERRPQAHSLARYGTVALILTALVGVLFGVAWIAATLIGHVVA